MIGAAFSYITKFQGRMVIIFSRRLTLGADFRFNGPCVFLVPIFKSLILKTANTVRPHLEKLAK